ncbi:uncharacterized protein LOC120176480 isoform X2 [Hibiscus syriacus]|uniref:uncharacterized protein LOC120176480 isoform X2 n=1 Tax=Hibiscus syriacus TaxID=106335 RepID=UPI001922610D|nr:uncharacterized protein LOC120176480 isoform X2 [Hibiscus syriacus]
MVREDKNYEEASFQFCIKHSTFNEEEYIEVKKCGVDVIYVDAERCTITDVMRCDKSNHNFNSQEDANTEEPHHHSATETSTRRSKRHRITETRTRRSNRHRVTGIE